MFFLRPISIFCGVALLLAFSADATILLLAHVTGGIGIAFKGRLGGVPLFFFFWVLAFVVGVLVARRLHVFPFFRWGPRLITDRRF